MKMPSEEFIAALEECSSSATGHINCELCGRVHFASTAGFDFLPGEVDRLLEQAAFLSDRYVDHGDESIRWDIVDGRQVVFHCPCGELRKTEKFIVDNRKLISVFLRKRHAWMQKVFLADAAVVDQLPEDDS